MLGIAAALCVGIGAAHSYLGERFILMRLFRRSGLPRLFGGEDFTRGTLRFAWHLTTLAWWGFGCLILAVSREEADLARTVLLTAGFLFALSGIFAMVSTRGRHLSWIVFALIAAITFHVGLRGP